MNIEFFSCVSFLAVFLVEIDVGNSNTTGTEGAVTSFAVCAEAVPSGDATALLDDVMVTLTVDMAGKAGVLVTT